MINEVKHSTEAYPYTTVPGDSLHTRIYRLSNGLTVYMSPYHDEPRIYTPLRGVSVNGRSG